MIQIVKSWLELHLLNPHDETLPQAERKSERVFLNWQCQMLPSDIEALYASGNGRDIDRSAFMGFKGDASLSTPSSLKQMEVQSGDEMIYTCMILSSQMQMMSSFCRPHQYTDVICWLFFLIHLPESQLNLKHSPKHSSLIHFKVPTFKNWNIKLIVLHSVRGCEEY